MRSTRRQQAPAKGDPRSEAKKPAEKGKRWGQVVTPAVVARRMATSLLGRRDERPLVILDPCGGPGTFPDALQDSGFLRANDELTVIDLDPEMIDRCSDLAERAGCKTQTICADYLEVRFDREYDAAILNPPYVRQEWLEQKVHYQRLFLSRYGVQVPGTSNLYVYFLIKMLMDLKPGGKFVAIVYDSWQATRYGQWLAQILDMHCEQFTVKTAANQPFAGRLIDATIICGRKRSTAIEGCADHPGSLKADRRGPFAEVQGFAALETIFRVRRGLRLKQADFFLSGTQDCARLGAAPFVKKLSTLDSYQVPNDHPEAALLLFEGVENPALVKELDRRLAAAEQEPEKNVSILTWYRERPLTWSLHRRPSHAPILFNYYLRRRPRHVYNPSRIYADNFYGLTPPEATSALAWLAVMNSTVVCTEILAQARNQGNGLAKTQLFEYRRAAAPDIRLCSTAEQSRFEGLGNELITMPERGREIISKIDELIAKTFEDHRLRPSALAVLHEAANSRARIPKSGRG